VVGYQRFGGPCCLKFQGEFFSDICISLLIPVKVEETSFVLLAVFRCTLSSLPDLPTKFQSFFFFTMMLCTYFLFMIAFNIGGLHQKLFGERYVVSCWSDINPTLHET
jgi:hypothetical protein